MWTWIHGSPEFPSPSKHGAFNVPSPDNVPGGRHYFGSTFDDKKQKFSIYGGWGYDSAGRTRTFYKLNIRFFK
jgi:hypothetical protein